MKKRNIIIIVSVSVFLAAVVAVFAFLNAGNLNEKKMLEEEAIILVKSADRLLGSIDMQAIESMGPIDFNANLDTSDSEAEEHQYSGVLLNDLFKSLKINIEDYQTLTAKAIDGYIVAYDSSEVADEGNIYIAIKRDGKPLGSKSSGGNGPYQIIVKKDAFSQRWCKFVIELELK
ncbi:MAG: hypothetical protein JW997_06760 [Actinobacteria bacterium]|nr:hypothetical protein [Actinomycetota bacterium]